jgi:hypothetical protein
MKAFGGRGAISPTPSSGSIVSDYRLDDRAIEVRSSVRTKDFSSSLCVQTGSGAQPASCTMGIGGPFPGGKARLGRDADHSPPSRGREWVGAIAPLPPSASMACNGTALLYFNSGSNFECGQHLLVAMFSFFLLFQEQQWTILSWDEEATRKQMRWWVIQGTFS